jgi:hypothetical protein
MVCWNIYQIHRAARPQLLIFDSHSSHNLEFIETARCENIILLELPSRTSHWTQSFDRSVFKSLKSRWNAELDNFIHMTGIAVGHAQFLKYFHRLWVGGKQWCQITSRVDSGQPGFIHTTLVQYQMRRTWTGIQWRRSRQVCTRWFEWVWRC